MAERDWDNVFFATMAMASVVMATIGVALALRSVSSIAGLGNRGPAPPSGLSVNIPKVHYEDSQVLVSVRTPGEWHELREFVNPLDPKVQQIYRQVGPDTWALYDWVCRNISYRQDDGEWWGFPGETIGRRSGDCDDSSITLCSLLLNFTDCYVVVGSYRGYGHAWVQTDSQILETTYTFAHAVPDPQNYRSYAMFNNQEIIERWPEALSNLFVLNRNECQKLILMAEA